MAFEGPLEREKMVQVFGFGEDLLALQLYMNVRKRQKKYAWHITLC